MAAQFRAPSIAGRAGRSGTLPSLNPSGGSGCHKQGASPPGERPEPDQRQQEKRQEGGGYSAEDPLRQRPAQLFPAQKIKEYIGCRQQGVERALPPAHQVVFKFLVPVSYRNKLGLMKHPVNGCGGKVIEVAGNIQMQPARSKGLGLQSRKIWHGDQYQPILRYQASNVSHHRPGVRHMFQAVPEGNAVEWPSIGAFIQTVEDFESQSPR